MMPINRRYPIAELLAATREYIAATNRRVSFEYVLLQGKNDTPEQAAALAELLQGMLCHVNLIPWNPVPGTPLGRSDRARVLRFQQVLQERGIACTTPDGALRFSPHWPNDPDAELPRADFERLGYHVAAASQAARNGVATPWPFGT